ncbi:MAG: hypothetical protein RR288_00665 [Oscillibacter sp.]
MDKRRVSKISAAIAVAMVLIIALLMSTSLRRTAHITLPTETAPSDQTPGGTPGEDNATEQVAITPETVQIAIETLARPAAYRRSVAVEQFWSGGSSALNTTVSVSGGYTRTDRTLVDGRVRHSITGNGQTYIWYNEETTLFSGPAAGITADDEQSIPTYETILTLPTASIAKADYRALAEGVNCIYVETVPDAEGYLLRYWVSVDSGLLAAAERERDGTVVYRMASLAVDTAQPTPADFTLPDGTQLLGSL